MRSEESVSPETNGVQPHRPALESEVESAFERCRRDYLALRGAIHGRNRAEVDDAYDRFGVTLRHYLRLVSVRLYLPMQHQVGADGSDPDQRHFLSLARGNMRQVAAFLRVYREPEGRRMSRFVRDVESLDRLLREQYRRECSDVLPSLDQVSGEEDLVA